MQEHLGNTTTNNCDSHGNLTSVTTPARGGFAAASMTSMGYSPLSKFTTVTDPLNYVTTVAFNSVGLISTTDTRNDLTTYGPDYGPRGIKDERGWEIRRAAV